MKTTLKDSTKNLCDNCLDNIATCTHANPQSVVFGNGVGEDNVIECDSFQNDGWLLIEEIQ